MKKASMIAAMLAGMAPAFMGAIAGAAGHLPMGGGGYTKPNTRRKGSKKPHKHSDYYSLTHGYSGAKLARKAINGTVGLARLR